MHQADFGTFEKGLADERLRELRREYEIADRGCVADVYKENEESIRPNAKFIALLATGMKARYWTPHRSSERRQKCE